jgi:predicted phosphodiesterase
MALYGLVADIHGNREALAAALAALEQRGVRQLLCLGDIVGYNADPDECVAMLRTRGALSIAGNHDLISLRQLDFARCSNKAMHALKRTRRSLAPASAAYLEALPDTRLIEQRVLLVHGGVRDVEQYMVTSAHIRQNAEYLAADHPAARLCFFGHSHEQRAYEVRAGNVRELPLSPEITLETDSVYFVNPGSIDASRKRGEKLAEFAVLDTAAWRVEFWRLPYDCAASEAKAAAFGYRIHPWLDRFYALRRRLLAAARISALRRAPAADGARPRLRKDAAR